MVRISLHRNNQKQIIKNAKIDVVKTKYNFSPLFSEKLYDFSEKNCTEHFKVFNTRFEEWLFENASMVDEEVSRIRLEGYKGTIDEIIKKIKISARFYYRKKSKKHAKDLNNEVTEKPYIGLSSAFIMVMDEFITRELLKGCRLKKQMFIQFTFSHVTEIERELAVLKERYDENEYVFHPIDIAKKFKKSFDNRLYIYYQKV